jgi:tetratricopeptide (TPR) repeat protein
MDAELRDTAKRVTLVTGMVVYLDSIPDARNTKLKAQTARGLTSMKRRQWEFAISRFYEALSHATRPEQSAALQALVGSCHLAQCRWQRALECFEESARLADQAGDKPGKAHALNYTGSTYCDSGELDQALKFHEEALAVAREIGDRDCECRALTNIGIVYRARGEPAKALRCHEKALAIAHESGNSLAEANNLVGIGLLIASKASDKALEYLNKALDTYRELGCAEGAASALNSIGYVRDQQGDHLEALELHNGALAQYRKIHDRRGEAKVLNNIGVLLHGAGVLTKALRYYKQALAIAHEVGDPEVRANNLNNVGLVYRDRGERDKALRSYESALAAARKDGFKPGAASALSNIGLIYAFQGELERAIRFLALARIIFTSIGAVSQVQRTTTNLRLLLLEAGRDKFTAACVEAGMTGEDAEKLAASLAQPK